jgi:hypothetical protein
MTRFLRRPHAPAWTDSNDSDPGVSLLEVLLFLAFAFLFALALRRWRTSRSAPDPPGDGGCG